MSNPKQEVITFKVDAELARILAAMPNRSAFIRQSVLKAIDNVCPLCQGSGSLSPRQKQDWEAFATDHLERCDECHVLHDSDIQHNCH